MAPTVRWWEIPKCRSKSIVGHLAIIHGLSMSVLPAPCPSGFPAAGAPPSLGTPAGCCHRGVSRAGARPSVGRAVRVASGKAKSVLICNVPHDSCWFRPQPNDPAPGTPRSWLRTEFSTPASYAYPTPRSGCGRPGHGPSREPWVSEAPRSVEEDLRGNSDAAHEAVAVIGQTLSDDTGGLGGLHRGSAHSKLPVRAQC